MRIKDTKVRKVRVNSGNGFFVRGSKKTSTNVDEILNETRRLGQILSHMANFNFPVSSINQNRLYECIKTFFIFLTP